MSDPTNEAAAEGPRVLTLEEIKARRPLTYVDTPTWGRLGLRRRMNVASLLACRSAMSEDGAVRDELESMLLLVQHGVADPKLDREAVEAMAEEDGAGFLLLFAEVMAALGIGRNEQQEAARTFRVRDEGSAEASAQG